MANAAVVVQRSVTGVFAASAVLFAAFPEAILRSMFKEPLGAFDKAHSLLMLYAAASMLIASILVANATFTEDTWRAFGVFTAVGAIIDLVLMTNSASSLATWVPLADFLGCVAFGVGIFIVLQNSEAKKEEHEDKLASLPVKTQQLCSFMFLAVGVLFALFPEHILRSMFTDELTRYDEAHHTMMISSSAFCIMLAVLICYARFSSATWKALGICLVLTSGADIYMLWKETAIASWVPLTDLSCAAVLGGFIVTAHNNVAEKEKQS